MKEKRIKEERIKEEPISLINERAPRSERIKEKRLKGWFF